RSVGRHRRVGAFVRRGTKTAGVEVARAAQARERDPTPHWNRLAQIISSEIGTPLSVTAIGRPTGVMVSALGERPAIVAIVAITFGTVCAVPTTFAPSPSVAP